MPNSLKSISYKSVGAILVDTEIQMKVVEVNSNLRSIDISFLPSTIRPYSRSGSPTDHNAKGTVRIDTSGDLIDIIDAEFSGQVFNLPMSLRVRKHKTE